MIQRCFALPYYVYCLRLRCLVSFLFYSTISPDKTQGVAFARHTASPPFVHFADGLLQQNCLK
ncbi:Uncharacterised protein [Neisseria animalis]|nr:Uncharacterised protein [Neisseria animalis]